MPIIENIFWVSPNTTLKRKAQVSLGEGSGKNLELFLLRKGHSILI